MAEDSSTKVEIGGRTLVECDPDDMTLDQGAYLHLAVEDAGLLEMSGNLAELVGSAIQAGKDVDEKAATDLSYQVILQIWRTRTYGRLIAGNFRWEGQPWSLEVADEIDEFVRGLKGQDVKDAIQGLLVRVVTAFFVSGLASVETSLRYSVRPRAEAGEAGGGEPNTAPTAAPSASDRSPPSSGS